MTFEHTSSPDQNPAAARYEKLCRENEAFQRAGYREKAAMIIGWGDEELADYLATDVLTEGLKNQGRGMYGAELNHWDRVYTRDCLRKFREDLTSENPSEYVRLVLGREDNPDGVAAFDDQQLALVRAEVTMKEKWPYVDEHVLSGGKDIPLTITNVRRHRDGASSPVDAFMSDELRKFGTGINRPELAEEYGQEFETYEQIVSQLLWWQSEADRMREEKGEQASKSWIARLLARGALVEEVARVQRNRDELRRRGEASRIQAVDLHLSTTTFWCRDPHFHEDARLSIMELNGSFVADGTRYTYDHDTKATLRIEHGEVATDYPRPMVKQVIDLTNNQILLPSGRRNARSCGGVPDSASEAELFLGALGRITGKK